MKLKNNFANTGCFPTFAKGFFTSFLIRTFCESQKFLLYYYYYYYYYYYHHHHHHHHRYWENENSDLKNKVFSNKIKPAVLKSRKITKIKKIIPNAIT